MASPRNAKPSALPLIDHPALNTPLLELPHNCYTSYIAQSLFHPDKMLKMPDPTNPPKFPGQSINTNFSPGRPWEGVSVSGVRRLY